METKLLHLLRDFAYGLQGISNKKVEMILPIDNFMQLKKELNSSENVYEYPSKSLTQKIIVNPQTEVTFYISCKEIEDNILNEKLQQCFKILAE